MGTYYAVQGGSRILDATRVDKSGSDNTNVTAWMRTSDFILAVNINSGGNDTAAAQYKLRWRNKTDSGTFADVGSTGAINYTATTDLVNGAAIAVGGRKCDSQGADTWQAGEEVEGASLSDSIDLLDEYETEIHFGLDCSGATFGKEYEFELYDSTNGASRGTCGATIALAMGTIAYSAGTNTITVTGYTEATPCNFTDIYNTDVAGSWGVVTRQCMNQFCFDCKLVIGDSSTATWFSDVSKMVVFTDIFTGNNQVLIELLNNSHFTLGELLNVNTLSTNKGCMIFVKTPSYIGDLVSCRSEASPTAVAKFYGCIFQVETTVKMYIYKLLYGEMYNCRVENGIILNTLTLTMDSIAVSKSERGATSAYGTSMTLKNIRATDISTYSFFGYMITADSSLVNAVFDSASWAVTLYPTSTGVLYRQYEFALTLVDSAGSGVPTTKVKIWDKDAGLVTNTTTNASGVLATQTLNYGYYNQAGGNTPTMKTPHEMRIYKYGKSMLSSKSSIEAKTDWALTMLTDAHITQTTEATVAAYTGITINHTAETITISENHTLDEIYDYCQYDIISSTKQLDQTIHTSDGVNFVSEYSFVVNTGITVTATDQKLSMVSGETYTLTGTAQFTGIIATTTTTRIPIKLTNIVDGSRYWVGKQSDGTNIFEGTQSGSGTVTGYYEHTANTDIDIRVRKSSAPVKYKPWVGEGTLIADTFSLRIRQIQDSIVT